MGDEMKFRLAFDPCGLEPDQAKVQLEELLELVGGKAGLFSKAYTPR
jgi:hypothetical protein